MEEGHVSNRFALSTDGITYEEAPVEPNIEFAYGQDVVLRGDQQRLALGGRTLRWFFGDEPIVGTDFYWYQKWVTGLSASIYVISKVGEVDAAGDPTYVEMVGVMGKPTGEIHSEEGDGQTFKNVEMEFWGLVPVP
jgi:hypothetical protein